MTPADLQDAKPQPRKGEKAKDPSPEAMALLLVGERVIEARNAVDEHMASGLPATGPLWDAKTTAYRTAWARFEADVMAMRRKVTS